MRDRRVVAAVAGGVTVIVLVVVLLTGGSSGSGGPPAADATRLVPADALVYLHLSTDTGRAGTARARTLAGRFPGYQAARDGLIRRLSAPGCGIARAALRSGREAALALVDVGAGSAGSLVYVDTGSTAAAAPHTCGSVQTAKYGRFLVVGQPQTLGMARDLAAGRGRSLAQVPAYRRELAKLPADRVADAWVTRDGVRRLLAPQGGLLGAAGTLLNQPGLRSVSAALTAQAHGAHLVLRSLRTPGSGTTGPFRSFDPHLQDQTPDTVFAYLGLSGLSGAAGRLLGLAGPQTALVAPLLARAGKDLDGLLKLFSGEVAATITADTPAPVLTLMTRTKDPAAARATLARSRAVVARLLKPASGTLPVWQQRQGAFQLRPSAGIELDYAVVDDLIVVSTRLSGIAAVRSRDKALSQTDGWHRVIGTAPDRVTSLVYVDFNQLLRLGEQTGLNDSTAYLGVKDDLQKLKTVGARSSSEGDESTVELSLSVP